MPHARLTLLIAALTVLLVACPGNPVTPEPPGTPPVSPPPQPPAPPPPTSSAIVAPIDTQNRAAVATAFNTVYSGAENTLSLTDADWSVGDIAACKAGTTSSAFKNATLRRVNFYRALAGLPNVTWSSSGSGAADAQAALLMAANSRLSHAPGTDWRCYTAAGKAGAGSSNLAGGMDGPEAIDAYMDDGGGNNAPVGHRRWILHPPRLEMASGDVPGWNALYVFGKTGARPSGVNFVAYPSPGFFPRDLLPRSRRWSFSVPNANFSGATVNVTLGGAALAVTTLPVQNGYGDHTLVWELPRSGVPATGDVALEVRVGNVVVGGSAQTYAYTTRVFSP
jgi:uncharacterized protein YkwD